MAETLRAAMHQVNWRDDDEARAFVDRCMRQRNEYSLELDRQAEQNIAWFMGHQYLVWTHGASTLAPIVGTERDRYYLTYNMLLPFVGSLVAKVEGEEVVYEVAPATADQEDYDAARINTHVLQYYSDLLNFPELINEADLWAFVTGGSIVRVTWDPERGSELDLPATVGMSPAEFKKAYGQPPETIGDLDVCGVAPMNVFWGPEGRTFEECDWLIEVSEHSRSYLAARFDVKPDELSDDSSEDQFYRIDDITCSGISRKRTRDDDVVTVRSLWIPRKRSGVKNGRYVVSCGEKVLHNGDNPYEHGEIPYAYLRGIVVPGRTRGMSYIENLRGPQSDINANVSQQAENRELMANPFVLAAKGTIADRADWNNLPGGIREYIGQAPVVVPGAGMPNSVMLQLERTLRFMQDIAGVHDVSMARVPAGVRSGVAIQWLQERDDSMLAPYVRRRKRFWERVGYLMLHCAAQYTTEERAVKIHGDEDRWEIMRYAGDDMRGSKRVGPGVKHFDVRVRTTGMPRSRIAKTELVNGLVQSQFLRPENPDDRRIVFETLELGDTGEIPDPERRDRQAARLENALLDQGTFVEPRDFDDLKSHVSEHDARRKRTDFRDLQPEVQAMYQAHIQRHMEIAAEKAFKQQMVVQQTAVRLGITPSAPPEEGNNGRAREQAGTERSVATR